MAPGEKDHVSADGDLREQGAGPIDIDLSKGLIPVIEEIHVSECGLSEHTFFEFDTDIEMKKRTTARFPERSRILMIMILILFPLTCIFFCLMPMMRS